MTEAPKNRKGCGDTSAVWQEEFLHIVTVRLEQDIGATQIPDLFIRPLDHAVPLARLGINHFACASDFEALLGAGFGFQLGHFALKLLNGRAV
jgi:hypothetical protein